MAQNLKWEYLEGDGANYGKGTIITFERDGKTQEKSLVNIGNDGWELIQVVIYPNENENTYLWIFKRLLQ